MRSQHLSELRSRAEYSPRWLLVPLVPVVVAMAAWLLTAQPGGRADATPVLVDSVDTSAVEQHGA